jgi:hypothetical protein
MNRQVAGSSLLRIRWTAALQTLALGTNMHTSVETQSIDPFPRGGSGARWATRGKPPTTMSRTRIAAPSLGGNNFAGWAMYCVYGIYVDDGGGGGGGGGSPQTSGASGFGASSTWPNGAFPLSSVCEIVPLVCTIMSGAAETVPAATGPVVIGTLSGAIGWQMAGPWYAGNAPTVEEIQTRCIALGVVDVPSTNKQNRGGKSVEQVYECPDGKIWTVPDDMHARRTDLRPTPHTSRWTEVRAIARPQPAGTGWNPAMSRRELIEMFVLNEIGDGYETIKRVTPRVRDLMTECGLTLDEAEIPSALQGLISAGFARAYRLSGILPNEEIEGVPQLSDMAALYYTSTEEGASQHERNETRWPFDQENRLRADWTPPDT